MVQPLELWKMCKENLNYEVSSLGNIRKISGSYSSSYRGSLVVRKTKPIIGKSKSKKGYLRVNLGGRIYLSHRIVASAFLPNIHNYDQINHKNGIKTDNRVENLEWASNSQNRDHAVANNLHAYGEKSSKKLLEWHILEIRRLLNLSVSQKQIAEIFGIVQQTVSKIKNKKTWKSVK